MTLFEEVARMGAIQYVCHHHRFETLADAQVYADRVFAAKGIVLGIEEIVRRRHPAPFAKRDPGYARRMERRNKRRARELNLAA